MSWRPQTNARLWSLQLTTLHTLYGRFSEKFSVETREAAREERIAWASRQIGRQVDSFKELTNGEAAQLIDFLKKALGQDTTIPRKRRSREAAMARGRAGRKDVVESIAILASPEDLAEIDRMRERAGMTREQFDSWMRSRRSPTHGRTLLRTVSDVNRVRWGLKSLLRRKEKEYDPVNDRRGTESGNGRQSIEAVR